MLECVVNLSEGRDGGLLEELAAAAGSCLLDVHTDAHHHRSVFTLAGAQVELAVRTLATNAVARIDLSHHDGVHPRIGAVDVVPFVPLAGSDLVDAIAARNRFASWAAAELALPCFLYGPERTLPELRRSAFSVLAPDVGPLRPHPTGGAVAVGARGVLVAFNLWLAPGLAVDAARRVAAAIRGPALRTLGLDVGGRAQVSCNLVEPAVLGPSAVYDLVAAQVEVDRAELVGLLPASILSAVPSERWRELDLDENRTIEGRLDKAGLDGPEHGGGADGDDGGSAGRGRR